MKPALAARTPGIAHAVFMGNSRQKMRQYCQGVHEKYIVSEWRERNHWNQIE